MRKQLALFVQNAFAIIIFFLFSFAFTNSIIAQTFVEKLRQEDKLRATPLKLHEPFAKSQDQQKTRDRGIAGDKQYLDLSLQFNKEIISAENERLQIKLPLTSTKEVLVNLKQVEILAPGFILRDSRGKSLSTEGIGKFYWGYAVDYPASTVAISVFNNEISGTIDLGKESYTLGKLENASEHIVYQERDLKIQPEVSCGTDDLKQGIEKNVESHSDRQNPNPNNCVNIYMEIDYDFYQVKGTLAATVNYMTSAFSQVAIFYDNENVNVKLSELKVWDTVDPYNGPTDTDYLNQIQAAFSGTSFNGDLAHLVGGSGGSGGSGIAYVNVLCASSYAFGYSVVGPTFQNVPTYSVTISVLAHELGHNMASPHTHACSWNGNNTQIDDCGNKHISNPGACYDANNPIIPSQGGTMMSYCHLESVGVDFSLGMGTQPGNLVRDKVYNATCLSPCASCDLPAVPVLATPANNAIGVATTAPLSWNAATDATSYDLQVGTSSGASNALDQNFTGTAVNLSGLSENTTYFWRVRSKNTCGVSAFSTEFSFTTLTSSSGDFSLATNPTSGSTCNNTSIQFNVTSTASGGFSDPITLSASGLPSGASANFATNPLTPGNSSIVTLSNFGANTGNFTVQISGLAGGITKTTDYTLTFNGPPSVPVLAAPLDNATNVAIPTDFDWSDVVGASSYDIQVSTSPGGVGLIVDENYLGSMRTVSGLNENTTYYWRVRAVGTCGNSAFSSDFTFTTAAAGTEVCNTYMSSNIPVDILDATDAISILTLSGIPNTISDIDVVNVTGTHTYLQDISFLLSAPNSGPQDHSLLDQICGNEDDFNISFDDEGLNASSIPCPPTDGLSYKPVTALTAFDGLSANGDWTLRVTDVGAGDEGVLSSWGLKVCYINTGDFTIASNPTSGSVCNNSSLQFDITSTSIDGFTDPVTLSSSGLPSGANASFSTNPLAPGNTTTVTLSNFGANTGNFTVQISGVAGGITKTTDYTLTLNGPPSVPVLAAPLDNATNVAIPTDFDWSDVVGASSYDIQVSTSPGGVGLIVDENYLGSMRTVSGLNENTTYYWRVRAVGTCGNSAFSSDFTFTTAAAGTEVCNTYMSSNIPVDILDATDAISTLTLSGIPSNITDIDVINVTGTHTYLQDISFLISAPNSGPQDHSLLSQICGNNDDFNISFDDEGLNASSIPCPPTNGLSYKPVTALTAFDGLDPNGVWTLKVTDVASGDEGELTSWGLKVCYETSGVCDLTVVTTDPTGPASLMAAIDCAESGNTITIDLPSNSVIDLGVLNMVFDKNLNIFSNNPIIIDCPQASEAIKIMSGSQLNLKNITIRQIP